jgi:Barstar (barnase inhibitor).
MINHDMFIFGEAPSTRAYIGRVPSGLRTKKELLEAVGKALGFPEYYGVNWDALEECIRDLEWLPPGVIVLEHEDLPMEGDVASQRTYLDILSCAVGRWRTGSPRSLCICFPRNLEAMLKTISN